MDLSFDDTIDLSKFYKLEEGYKFYRRINIELPNEICNLFNLSKLYLDGYIIQKISTCIINMSNLTELALSNYKIPKNFIETLINLKKLTLLYLDHCDLVSLSGISNLITLKELTIKYNKLSKISEDLFKLINLEKLSLSNGCLSVIPTQISNLVNLSVLNLDHNNLSFIPIELC